MAINGGFEIFTVKYRLPVFGTEGREFHPETHEFLVSTQGGKKDAEEACKKYHPGCKVELVMTRMETLCNLEGTLMTAKQKQTANTKKK